MSKSLGNGVDPMDVVDEYGADALRWFLLNGTAPGVKIILVMILRRWVQPGTFINKIWNASRFVLMNRARRC